MHIETIIDLLNEYLDKNVSEFRVVMKIEKQGVLKNKIEASGEAFNFDILDNELVLRVKADEVRDLEY